MLTLISQHLRNALQQRLPPALRQDNPSTGMLVGAVALLAVGTGVAWWWRKKTNEELMELLGPGGPLGPTGPIVQPDDPFGPTPVAPSSVPTVQIFLNGFMNTGKVDVGFQVMDAGIDAKVSPSEDRVVITADTLPVDVIISVEPPYDDNGNAYPNATMGPVTKLMLSPAAKLTGGIPGETLDLMFRVKSSSDVPAIEFRTGVNVQTGPNNWHSGDGPVAIIFKKRV